MLNKDQELSAKQEKALKEVLSKKVKIYSEGAKKRGKAEEAEWAEGLLK